MTTASVVTFSTSPHELERLVRCLRADGVARIFIIDHSPDDALRDLALSLPDSEYLREPNRGFGAGHNLAICKAIALGARYHLAVNADVYWQEPVLPRLEKLMDADPEIGLMIPRVLYPDGKLQYVCRLLPSPIDLIAARIPLLLRRRLSRYRMEDSGYTRTLNVPFLHGCFMLMRVEALRAVGLFDENFFLYMEDTDLCRRIHSRYLTLYFPDATIYHAHARASHSNIRMLGIHAASALRYFRKWGWINDSQRKEINRRASRQLYNDSEL